MTYLEEKHNRIREKEKKSVGEDINQKGPGLEDRNLPLFDLWKKPELPKMMTAGGSLRSSPDTTGLCLYALLI